MLLPASTQPSHTIALKPIIATPMAMTHMRMRVQSPMVTMSATAPIVQKCVRCAMAPKSAAKTKAAHSTWAASADRSISCTVLLQRREALPGRRGRFGLRIGLDQIAQRAACRLGILQLDLAVGQREHGFGCTRMIRRRGDEAVERCDRALVVALAVLRIAQPEARGVRIAA